MKLMEIYTAIGNKILELPIVEHASKTNEAENKMHSLSLEIVKHLVKIYKWNDEQNVKNHLSDISSWMYDLSKVRVANKKRPSFKQCYEWIVTDIFDSVDELTVLINSMDKYQHLPVNHSNEEVYMILVSILEPFCKDISSGTFKNSYDYITRVN